MKQTVLETYLTEHALECTFVESKELRLPLQSSLRLIDVRESHEYDALRIEGAVSIPRGRLEMDVERLAGPIETPLVVVCKSDLRARMASITLQRMGYLSVRVLRGGMDA